MKIRFITGEPAVMLPGRALVIADLHIGAEYEFRRAGIKMPSNTRKLLEKAESLARQAKAKRLIILGDIKHKVPGLSLQEEREVPHFLNQLRKGLGIDVEIVTGNHDDGLQKLVPDLTIHPSSGILVGDTYLTHGHTWPSPDFLQASHILTGHRHPMIEFRDRLGYVWRERVWVRTRLKRETITNRYKGMAKQNGRIPELVMMPAFNDMVGGVALNRKKQTMKLKRKMKPLGPLLKAADKSRAKVYMLDGTYLGRLSAL